MTALKLTAGKVHDLALGKISPDPEQPRKAFGKEGLQMLANSIKTDGVLQPITVRVVKGKVLIVTGERRWRASKLAGKKTIPAILDTGSDDVIARGLRQVAENEIREGLNHMELAEILVRMRTQEHKSDTEIAKALEKHGMQHVSRSGIANYLRLVELPDWAKDMIRAGTLTGSHGKYLLMAHGLPKVEAELQREIKKVINWKGTLTVRDAEEAVTQSFGRVGVSLEHGWSSYQGDSDYAVRQYRAFDIKVCQGCEFFRTVGKTRYCINPAEFQKKNIVAIQDQMARAKGRNKDSDKPLAPAAEKKREADNARMQSKGVQTRIEQHLEDWLRKHLVEVAVPDAPISVHHKLMAFLACMMPDGKSTYRDEGADLHLDTNNYRNHVHHDLVKALKRYKLQAWLHAEVTPDDDLALAQACVRHMSREMIHDLGRYLSVELDPAFRITEEYLVLLRRPQLEALAKKAQLATIAGWTGKKIKTELLLPENVDRIGVPADVAKLYKAPAVSQETDKAA